MTARIIDLIAPIGKGQRGLIVSPPKAGKTTIMKQIAASIEVNNPEVHLIVLLVDERPEEVTDMRRWLLRGEVAASTFDRPSEEHTARRRAGDRAGQAHGRGGQGRRDHPRRHHPPGPGLQPGRAGQRPHHVRRHRHRRALPAEEVLRCGPQRRGGRLAHHPRHRAGRDRLPHGRGDLRGVQGHRATWSCKLDRRLAERRIYPAIDVDASLDPPRGALFERKQLQQVWKLRGCCRASAARARAAPPASSC